MTEGCIGLNKSGFFVREGSTVLSMSCLDVLFDSPYPSVTPTRSFKNEHLWALEMPISGANLSVDLSICALSLTAVSSFEALLIICWIMFVFFVFLNEPQKHRMIVKEGAQRKENGRRVDISRLIHSLQLCNSATETLHASLCCCKTQN